MTAYVKRLRTPRIGQSEHRFPSCQSRCLSKGHTPRIPLPKAFPSTLTRITQHHEQCCIYSNTIFCIPIWSCLQTSLQSFLRRPVYPVCLNLSTRSDGFRRGPLRALGSWAIGLLHDLNYRAIDSPLVLIYGKDLHSKNFTKL